jgi:RNA polymerase sigma-70 factor (ECF subfamily)
MDRARSSPRFFFRQSLRLPSVNPAAPGLGDAELLEAFRQGDVKAFEELVRRYQRPVLAIARRFARDQDDAEDLAQRAFINASERAGGWRGGSFKSWLFRIVVNLAKNHVRDTARFERSPRADDAQEQKAAPEESNADARIEAAQQQQALREAVAALPKRQREVLLLRIDGDLPFAEIAQTLGITETNAKVNFHHAVQKLKSMFGQGERG